MPNRNYLRGRRIEYLCQNELRALGYEAWRTAGSHGIFDVIAAKKTQVLFIQCKAYKPTRAELKQIARDANCLPKSEHISVQLWCRYERAWHRKELKRHDKRSPSH